jgi:glycosyltransferase involved in cell wall biosynthesis
MITSSITSNNKANTPFSVLLATYYKENPIFLTQALNSIFNQTTPPGEVVLVKDGPLTPELDTVIAKFQEIYPELKVIPLEKNPRLGAVLNEGLKHCSFEWVARMDTDDICFPDRFEKQLKYIEQHPEASFVGSNIVEFVNDITNVHSSHNLPEKHEDIYRYAKRRCPMNQPVIMFRKSAVLNCGCYRDYTYGEDYDLWVRALIKGYKFYNIQEPLLYFRIDKNTIKRRGGWWYLKIDLAHQKEFYKMGFISFPLFLYKCLIRIVIRSLPIQLRAFIYFKFLRK